MMTVTPYLSIFNGLFLVLPICYVIYLYNVKYMKIYTGVIFIILYGILECISAVVDNIYILYFGDILLLAGSLVLFAELIKLDTNKRFISNPSISVALIFIFLLGIAITNNLLKTPFLFVSIIYYIAIVTIAHIYQLLNNRKYQIPETLLIVSIIICYIFDTKYFSGEISVQAYYNAPWYIQYVLQSLAGLICFIGIKFDKKNN